MPGPIEPIAVDMSATSTGATIFSLRDEAEAIPRVGVTQLAWTAILEYWTRILRERCMMREMLQVANGGAPDPDPVCQPR